MSRRAVLTLALSTVAVAGAVAALPAGAAPAGGGCQLSGTAAFTKGPSITAHPYTYTFRGTLTSCQSNASTPASGTIATLVPAKGTGTCQNGTTAGTALVTWADKTRTLVSYTTQSAAAEVVLQGKVIPSYRVGRTTYRTTRFAGAGAASDLVFEASPAECAGSGVKSAGIAGFVGLGNQ